MGPVYKHTVAPVRAQYPTPGVVTLVCGQANVYPSQSSPGVLSVETSDPVVKLPSVYGGPEKPGDTCAIALVGLHDQGFERLDFGSPPTGNAGEAEFQWVLVRGPGRWIPE
jgi:hypothetical protein